MSASDPQAEKRRLRLEMRSRLAEVTPETAAVAGRDLADRFGRLDVWHSAARVGLFMSRPDEIDTGPLARRTLEVGKILLLPRVTQAGLLEFIAVDELERLEPGRFGILEPSPGCPVTTPAADDLVCVPGLAFDRSGGRLGRGGGYYDRTFASTRGRPSRPWLFGIGFSFQLIARVPMTDRDQRLDGVITDGEVVVSGGRGSRPAR